jgi:hypothetical protein
MPPLLHLKNLLISTLDKTKILQEAFSHFSQKLKDLESHIKTVQDAANQESKSSVGDKYETGRAMAQNEVFMLKTQFEGLRIEVEKLGSLLQSDPKETAGSGSLVKTTQGQFLLGPALGKWKSEHDGIFYLISLDAPLGHALQGKRKGETFEVNQRTDKIKDIF